MYYTGVDPRVGEVEMPQVRPMQQSLFPELSGTFRESESFATLNQEARHDSHRRIEHHTREPRLHFGVDATPGLPEPARQGGDELLPEPPQGSGRTGIGGDNTLYAPAAGSPGLGDTQRSAFDGPSDGPGPGTDLRPGLPAAGVGRQLILEGDAKATQLDFGIGSDDSTEPATPKPILPPDPF